MNGFCYIVTFTDSANYLKQPVLLLMWIPIDLVKLTNKWRCWTNTYIVTSKSVIPQHIRTCIYHVGWHQKEYLPYTLFGFSKHRSFVNAIKCISLNIQKKEQVLCNVDQMCVSTLNFIPFVGAFTCPVWTLIQGATNWMFHQTAKSFLIHPSVCKK